MLRGHGAGGSRPTRGVPRPRGRARSRLARAQPPLMVPAWLLPVALGVAGAAEAELVPEIADGSPLPAVFAASMALPLLWRDRHPMEALAGTLAVFAVQEVAG